MSLYTYIFMGNRIWMHEILKTVHVKEYISTPPVGKRDKHYDIYLYIDMRLSTDIAFL